MNILEEVKYFCEQKNTVGALLLTGKWGSGKSYFVESELRNDEYIKEKFAIVKISLFGISNAKEFNIELKKEYINVKFGGKVTSDKFNKTKEVLKNIGKAIPQTEFLVSADWSIFVSIDKIGEKEVLLVFDDLERCKLDMQVTLGLLNEYIENKGIKTIVIADEEKIRKEDDYKAFKEKIISRTIKLEPNIKNIVSSVVENYIHSDEGYKTFLINNLDRIVKVFSESGTNNIRSLKSGIQDYERFYKVISSSFSEDEIISIMMYNFLSKVFEYKAGNTYDMKTIYTSGTSENISSAFSMQNKYKHYDVRYMIEGMESWIVHGAWNEESIKDQLVRINESFKQKEPKSILLNSSFITYVEDKILDKGFEPLLEDAYKGEIDLNGYISILLLVHNATNLEIKLPCMLDVKKLKIGLEKRIDELKSGEKIESSSYVKIIGEDSISSFQKDMQEVINEIEEFREMYYYSEKRPTIIKALKDNNVEVVMDLISKYSGPFDEEYSKAIWTYFLSCNNYSKMRIINELKLAWDDYRLYSEENKVTTYDGLKFLYEQSNKIEKGGSISSAIINILAKDINKVIVDKIKV